MSKVQKDTYQPLPRFPIGFEKLFPVPDSPTDSISPLTPQQSGFPKGRVTFPNLSSFQLIEPDLSIPRPATPSGSVPQPKETAKKEIKKETTETTKQMMMATPQSGYNVARSLPALDFHCILCSGQVNSNWYKMAVVAKDVQCTCSTCGSVVVALFFMDVLQMNRWQEDWSTHGDLKQTAFFNGKESDAVWNGLTLTVEAMK